jgi:hypothetical protein
LRANGENKGSIALLSEAGVNIAFWSHSALTALFLGRAPPADGWGRRISSIFHYFSILSYDSPCIRDVFPMYSPWSEANRSAGWESKDSNRTFPRRGAWKN